MRRRARLGPLLAAAVAAAALLPATASGSVRLGPDLTQPLPSGGFHFAALGCQAGQYSPCALLNLRSTNPDALAAAPTDGVVTSWSLRGGCCTDPQSVTRVLKIGTFKLGTQDGLGGYGYAVPNLVGPSFELPPGNQFTADAPLTLPAHMPISAGERVGIIADNPIALSVYDTIPGVTGVAIANGVTYNGEGYGVVYGAAIAISAVVEPDADHDGYGDETQDCQPADAALHGTECAQPPPSVPTPLPVAVGGSSCGSGCGGGPSTYVSPPQITGPVPPSGDGIHFYIPLTCPKAATRPCGGFLVIVPGGATKAAHSAAAAYARTSYSIPPGASAKVKLTLSKAARKLLKRRHRLKVTIQIQPSGGTPTTLTRTLVTKAPKKQPKRR